MYPATSSDSASAKSNGALFISSKKEIIIKPNTKKKVKINQLTSCKIINEEKLNDSENNTKFKNIKPKKISKLATNKQARIEAKTAYLFLLKNPVRITQKLNKRDNKDAYTKLYSISKIHKLGLQTELTQKV